MKFESGREEPSSPTRRAARVLRQQQTSIRGPVQNKESGLPDSRAGARLRQQPSSFARSALYAERFCFIGRTFL